MPRGRDIAAVFPDGRACYAFCYADDATRTALGTFYVSGASIRYCVHCGSLNTDWGADSILNVLYERWLLTHDPMIASAFAAIATGEPDNTSAGASDQPLWDAVAAVRAYDVTGDPRVLQKALDDYHSVTNSTVFDQGACKPIDYQFPNGQGNQLKTLETDANRILAGVLLSQRATDTMEAQRDLADAKTMYAAVRQVFLDATLPLYTVYVFDTGANCSQLPRRFFASVNGLMIEARAELANATSNQQYMVDARATADAIENLSDSAGIFVDEQAENDIVEPLVLGMLKMYRSGDTAARDWIVRNAEVAAHARAGDGTYSRFFDGPPPQAGTNVSVFQTNGALGLMIAAGYLAPTDMPDSVNPWASAVMKTVGIHGAPASFTFNGSGIALIGSVPNVCVKLVVGSCEDGHVHLRIDGADLVDETGIWQGNALIYPVSGANTILFAWRWPMSGTHTLQFDPVLYNGKEGHTAIDISSALVIP